MQCISLHVYFASGTPLLYGALRVQASTAVRPVRSTQHVHFSSSLTQHYPTLYLYRPQIRASQCNSHRTPIAQASVFILVPYAKRHMDKCVEVCLALCAMHQLCMCTSPQEHISCMVCSVFRRPLPCNPSAAHMCLSHRRLRNTALLSACTGHQTRASQCTPHCTPVEQASVYILVYYTKHHMDTCTEVCWALCTTH